MPPVEPEAVTVEEEVVVEAEPPAISSTGTVMLSRRMPSRRPRMMRRQRRINRKVGFTISEGGADPGLARAISFAPQAAASKIRRAMRCRWPIDQAVAKHEQDIADGLPASAPPSLLAPEGGLLSSGSGEGAACVAPQHIRACARTCRHGCSRRG